MAKKKDLKRTIQILRDEIEEGRKRFVVLKAEREQERIKLSLGVGLGTGASVAAIRMRIREMAERERALTAILKPLETWQDEAKLKPEKEGFVPLSTRCKGCPHNLSWHMAQDERNPVPRSGRWCSLCECEDFVR